MLKRKDEFFIPLDRQDLMAKSGNLYKSIVIVGQRSNQLTTTLKEELTRKLAEFAPAYDNLEEVIENKEQIEISRFYERKAKTTEVAIKQFMDDELYVRDPNDGSI